MKRRGEDVDVVAFVLEGHNVDIVAFMTSAYDRAYIGSLMTTAQYQKIYGKHKCFVLEDKRIHSREMAVMSEARCNVEKTKRTEKAGSLSLKY